jgi:IS5 family transposase
MILGSILRIHFMALYPVIEEPLYDMTLLQDFAKLDAFVDYLPDEATMLRFRYL